MSLAGGEMHDVKVKGKRKRKRGRSNTSLLTRAGATKRGPHRIWSAGIKHEPQPSKQHLS